MTSGIMPGPYGGPQGSPIPAPSGGKMALLIFLVVGIFVAIPMISLLIVFVSSEDFSLTGIGPILPMLIFFAIILISIIARLRRVTVGPGERNEEDAPSDQPVPQKEPYVAETPIKGNKASVKGRCPKCDNLIFMGDRQCFKCGWKVRDRRLRPIED